jgi:hypothetical protein
VELYLHSPISLYDVMLINWLQFLTQNPNSVFVKAAFHICFCVDQ